MNKHTVYIGIDPGKLGGIACICSDPECGLEVWAERMPATERDIWYVIQNHAEAASDHHSPTMGLIERLGQVPRDKPKRGEKIGRAKQSPSSMLKMGTNYGLLRMALIAAAIPFDDVLPVKWQAEFGLLRKSPSETITAKKNRHKAKAQQLFPALKVTHAIADALLICEYLRRREIGGRAMDELES